LRAEQEGSYVTGNPRPNVHKTLKLAQLFRVLETINATKKAIERLPESESPPVERQLNFSTDKLLMLSISLGLKPSISKRKFHAGFGDFGNNAGLPDDTDR